MRAELGPDVEVETHIEPLQIGGLPGRDAPNERVAAVRDALNEIAANIAFVGQIHDVRVRETADGEIVNFHCRVDPLLTGARRARASRRSRTRVAAEVSDHQARDRPRRTGPVASHCVKADLRAIHRSQPSDQMLRRVVVAVSCPPLREGNMNTPLVTALRESCEYLRDGGYHQTAQLMTVAAGRNRAAQQPDPCLGSREPADGGSASPGRHPPPDHSRNAPCRSLRGTIARRPLSGAHASRGLEALR